MLGSELWQDLSKVIGERVTKKNLHLVLKHTSVKTNEDRLKCKQLSPEIKVLAPQLDVEFRQFPDSALSLDSPYYIKRSLIEEQVFAEIQQPGCLLRVKAPRHFGKTSLLYRLFALAIEQEYKSVYINFREADETIFADLNQFLL